MENYRACMLVNEANFVEKNNPYGKGEEEQKESIFETEDESSCFYALMFCLENELAPFKLMKFEATNDPSG